MQFGSLKTELIFSTIKNEIAALNGGDFECGLFPKSLKLIEQEYPQLSKEQAMSLIELVGNALYEKQKEIEIYNQTSEIPIICGKEENIRYAVAVAYLALIEEVEKYVRYEPDEANYIRNTVDARDMYDMAWKVLL